MAIGILYDPGTFEQSGSQSIWGAIWVEFDGIGFPESRWNDMPVAVMCEFVDCIRELGDHKVLSRMVRFFDGPFWVKLESSGEGFVSVCSGGPNALNAEKREIGTAELIAVIRNQSTEILRICQARGWAEQKDVRRMSAMITSLGW